MSNSKILLVVIVFAFITRTLLLLAFPLQDTDYYMINSAAVNLANGHGLGFQRSDVNDLSTIYFEGLRLWPPLVTIVLSGLFKITGDITFSNNLLLLLCLMLLFYYLQMLFSAINLSLKTQILCFLFIALNPDIIKQPGLSDLAAATFCIGSCLFAHRLLASKHKKKLSWLILYGVILFLPSAFRYQYYPITFCFPLSLYLVGHFGNDLLLKKQSIILFLIIAIGISVQEIFLYTYTYQPLSQSIAMDNKGIFIYNLYFVYPFFLKTFLNLSYIENKFYTLFQLLRNHYSLAALGLFIIWILSVKSDLHKQKEIATRKSFIYLLTVILLMPFATLLMLSLFLNSRSGEPGGWTYVTEGRYYILTSLLILAVIAWQLQSKIQTSGFSYFRKVKIVLLSVSIYNVLLTGKFYINLFNNNIPDKQKYFKSDRKTIDSLLTNYSNQKTQTLLTYNDPFYAFYEYKPNIAVTQKVAVLAQHKFSTSKKLQLLIITNKPLTSNDSNIVTKTKATMLARLNTSQLYVAEIHPPSTKNP